MKEEDNNVMDFYIKTLNDLVKMNLISANEKTMALQFLTHIVIEEDKQKIA